MHYEVELEQRGNGRWTHIARFFGPWNWEAVYQFAEREALPRVAQGIPTETVIDYRCVQLSANLPSLSVFRRARAYDALFRTLVIVIAPFPAIRTIADVYARIRPEFARHYEVVDDDEQARACLARYDQSLASLYSTADVQPIVH